MFSKTKIVPIKLGNDSYLYNERSTIMKIITRIKYRYVQNDQIQYERIVFPSILTTPFHLFTMIMI